MAQERVDRILGGYDLFNRGELDQAEVHDLEDQVVVIARVHGTGRDSGAEVTTAAFPQVWTWSADRIVRVEMFPTSDIASEAIGKDWR